MRSRIAFAFVFAAAFILSSCATARKTQTAPAAQPEAAATPVAKKHHARPGAKGTFKVEKGQTLWSIAKSAQGYDKSCQWPLIYKANKTVIQDPDLIYPGQEISIPKSVPATEADKACEAAGQYGPYQPHSKPREDVKLDF